MQTIRAVTEEPETLGESPVWSPADDKLYWIDWQRPLLFDLDPRTGERRQRSLREGLGCFVRHRDGGLVLAMSAGLQHLDLDSGALTPIGHLHPGAEQCGFNDGKCDRAGRFWVGTMHESWTEPKGALFRVDPDGSARAIVSGLVMPNGMAWSPDDRVLYYADTGIRTIFACDYDLAAGEITGGPRVFATVAEPAVPDGATVDADGFLWSATYDGWRLTRYDPKGRIDRVVELPVQQPASLTFGGDGLDTLYVTTARWELDEAALAAQPLAGRVLALDVGVRGLPEPTFTG